METGWFGPGGPLDWRIIGKILPVIGTLRAVHSSFTERKLKPISVSDLTGSFIGILLPISKRIALS
jgi:hypothetical protein